MVTATAARAVAPPRVSRRKPFKVIDYCPVLAAGTHASDGEEPGQGARHREAACEALRCAKSDCIRFAAPVRPGSAKCE